MERSLRVNGTAGLVKSYISHSGATVVLMALACLAYPKVGVADEVVIQSWDLETNPGWSLTQEWQIGTPLGGGGTQYGYPDPTAGHSGTGVLGINLAGDYSTTPGGPYYATTGPINCTGSSYVTLRFWQWLNAEALPYAYFGVEASNDGVNWSVLWYNGYSEITSNQWQQVDVNLSSVAANKPAVYLRWGYAFDTGARAMSGWNIDDVQIVVRQPSDKPGYFRGLWADAFQIGFKSTAEIDQLISRAVQGNYNAILPELLAYHDDTGSGHGAYWASNIVPRAKDNGGIDSLAYLLQRAHAQGIEVHPWILPYRVSKAWEPTGNTFLKDHPEYLMGPRESIGTRSTVGGAYILDPGSPDVQDYLVSIVRELVTNYPIDGIHYDYIRYESTNAGYPSDATYARSGLKRFQQITGYTGTPPATGEPLWDDFRRREVTELVRRVRAEIASIRIPGRPTVRFSAAVIGGYTSGGDFSGTTPYAYCYQDWAMWLQKGFLDAACPMLYDREHCPNDAYWYRAAVDSSVGWRGSRHLFAGQATYLNSFDNSNAQLEYTRLADADGSVTYSYAGLRALETICDDNNGWASDAGWFTFISQASFAVKKPTPAMPWRDPDLATEGTVYGRVTDSVTGQPIDNATVQVDAMTPVKTDGNGYYVTTLIPAVKAGTIHTITASSPTASRTHSVLVLAGDVRRNDFRLGPVQAPEIVKQGQATSACPGSDAALTVVAAGEEVSLVWRKDGVDLVDDGHYGGTTTDRLTLSGVGANDVGTYTCVVTNSMGFAESLPVPLSLKISTAITQQPQAAGMQLHADAEFMIDAVGTGLKYKWRRNGAPLISNGEVLGVNTATLRILNVTAADLGSYDCEVTADCGAMVSTPANLYLGFAPGDFDADGDVDVEDFGFLQVCLTGVSIPQTDIACRKALLDDDTDVDKDDAALFVRCLSGPGVPAQLDCWN